MGDLYPGAQKVALLLPMSGRASAIGKNLERTAKLAVPKDSPSIELVVHDTKGEPAGAAAAAGRAVGGGAKMILGPVFAAETQAAAEAAGGRVPLIAFTNDVSQINRQAFIFGLTPDQSVSAMLGYAKSKGTKRVGVVTQPGEMSAQAADAALRLGEENGIKITAVVAGSQGSLVEKLRSESGGKLPDAVLLPGGGDALIADVEALQGSGVQLLGTEQWLGSDLASSDAFEGAWFAAPAPPDPFANAFAGQSAARPGILAGLVYDAVNMARVLAVSGDMSEDAVMRTEGFKGALGAFRFRPNRSCDRDLAIMAIDAEGMRVIATSSNA